MTQNNKSALSSMLDVDFKGIPLELQAIPRWVMWSLVNRNGTDAKIPFTINGTAASSTNPDKWASFDDVADTYIYGGFSGLGFVFTGEDYHGIDIDDCRDPVTGELSELAVELLDRVAGYAEVSPSGTGIKMFVKTNLDSSRTLKDKGIELYRDGRYFTVTGHALPGHESVSDEVQDLSWFIEKHFNESLGEVFSGDAFETYKPTLEDWDLDRVEAEVLPHLNPDMGYDDWFRVGTALHHQGQGDHEWLEAWDAWSAGSDKYSEGMCQAKWDSFSEQRSQGRGAYTLASLLKITKAARATSKVFKANPKEPFHLKTIPELLAQPPIQWLVKGVLPRKGFAVLFGASGSGKTFITLDLCLAVARGVDWHGVKVKQRGVVYVAAEGGGGLAGRIKAYQRHHRVDLSEVPFSAITAGLSLLDGDDARVIESIESMSAKGNDVGLVVLDTLNRSMGGGDENSSQDMGKFIAAASRIGEKTGSLVLIVHHCGKDASKGARGHSSLKAALDAELELKRQEDLRVLTVSKVRDGPDGQQFAFKLNSIKLGVDEDLEDIESCVAVESDIPKTKIRPEGKWQKRVYDLLDIPLSDGMTQSQILDLISEDEGLPERWKESVIKAIDTLIEKGVILLNNNQLLCLS